MNKRKIFNDPVYGFINIYSELVFDIIEHPYFQRLRRIRQVGLTELVYPGALHTRFHHAIGAMHLMGKTLDSLRAKGQQISDDEYEASLIAILLHDIGHGPFSHALEQTLLHQVAHESMSFLLMKYFEKKFGGNVSLAMEIFKGSYHRAFFHQLVSSQLDMDRLDYLKRDSFFTGVTEGTVGIERIIKMLDVVDGRIVVEEKGIYSIERFLNARRIMYWQVYLHKTSVSAEKMLISIINRAKDLSRSGVAVFASEPLSFFLNKPITLEDFQQDKQTLSYFAQLDDYDIWGAIKIWSTHPDKILSSLSQMLLNRKLFRISLAPNPIRKSDIEVLRENIANAFSVLRGEARYFFAHGLVSNAAYLSEGQSINILKKDGQIVDIAKASDLPNIEAISKIVRKYYLCHPKNVSL